MKKFPTHKSVFLLCAFVFLLSTFAFAADVRVFQNPDGSVRILRLNPRRPGITLAGEAAKDSSLTGLPFVDVDEATLPTDRINRDKWRVQGQKVVVDKTVPDRPHPKQALIDRANAATTVAELKQIVVDLIRNP